MKKLLLSILTLATLQLFAQKDLKVILDSPAVGQNLHPNQAFNIKTTLKNIGSTTISATDSIYLYVVVANNILTQALVTHGAIAAGDSINIPINGYAINFTAPASGVQFCMVTYLRFNGNLDSNTANNAACSSVNLVLNTGVEELAAGKTVNVYPNPAVDVLNIEYNYRKASTVVIYDITGKTVETMSVASGSTQVNVSSYNKGIYLYEIISADNQKIKSGRFSVIH